MKKPAGYEVVKIDRAKGKAQTVGNYISRALAKKAIEWHSVSDAEYAMDPSKDDASWYYIINAHDELYYANHEIGITFKI